jgi:hypothetical protein
MDKQYFIQKEKQFLCIHLDHGQKLSFQGLVFFLHFLEKISSQLIVEYLGVQAEKLLGPYCFCYVFLFSQKKDTVSQKLLAFSGMVTNNPLFP